MVISDVEEYQLEVRDFGDFHHAFMQDGVPLGIPRVHSRPVVERKAVISRRDAGCSCDFLLADTIFQQVTREAAADVEVAEGTVLPLGHADDSYVVHRSIFPTNWLFAKTFRPRSATHT